ncbi:bifunctional folylpolyglutamate synthase/dihydrofolate synthase [Baaleninema sp.]|uniref:bifunctional folylpolyglutamate synthase/dihydrofolate synthase n=1 Tax=Baaleninema sp. TaxID=3101197 RepID=UPI003CFD41B0
MLDSLLQQFARFGVHLGLDRIRELLTALDNPHQRVPIVHVAGTNGKGSVCAYLSSVLSAAGYRTGRYTSPHLTSWCERICIDGTPISESDFIAIVERVAAAIDPAKPTPTQFEIVTAAAFLYFAESNVDIAVLEVGLGGRLDATNVCDRPLACVITSISRDHWQRLGSTLAEIAFEKAGILKRERPAILGTLPDDAAAVFELRIEELNCPAVWIQPATPISETEAIYDGLRYPLPLPGDVQLLNSALAIATIKQLRPQGWEISDAAICRGMQQARWRGRLEWITWRERRILVDGAHNVASAEVLRRYVETLETPVTWVMGILSTKDAAGILKTLLRSRDSVRFVPVPSHGFTPPEDLRRMAIDLELDVTCSIHDDVETALAAACEDEARLPVLCGSLYLIGDFFASSSVEQASL